MNTKADLSNEKSFYIWFDKNNKKEYYATGLTLFNAKVKTSKNSKYSYIYYTDSFLPKVSPKRNRAEYIKNALKPRPLDLYNPYEERYGMFLINFLNARLDTWYNAYKDFIYAYGLGIIEKYSKKKMKLSYENIESFKGNAKTIFENAQVQLYELQSELTKCVDYIYNLNGNEEDKEYEIQTKFKAYSLKHNLSNKYTQNTEVLLNSLSIFKNDFISAKLSDLTQGINNINMQNGIKYSSRYLDNICFIVLSELVNNNITIKTCKHCGRYFIPVNRQAEVYCDLTPRAINGTKCRELGARTTYAKNVKEVDGLLIYRRTYQKRLMELSRNPNATEKERKDFNNWKKSAQAMIKDFKKEKITEEQLKVWMEENKDK